MQSDREKFCSICRNDGVIQELMMKKKTLIESLDFNEYIDDDGDVYMKTNHIEIEEIKIIQRMIEDRERFLIRYYHLNV